MVGGEHLIDFVHQVAGGGEGIAFDNAGLSGDAELFFEFEEFFGERFFEVDDESAEREALDHADDVAFAVGGYVAEEGEHDCCVGELLEVFGHVEPEVVGDLGQVDG